MKIKVCGLREIENINALDEVQIHMVGLNFYHKSKRFIDHSQAYLLSNYRKHPKVGVFVNARIQYLYDMVKIYGLEYVQLHGNESPEYVEAAMKAVKVIKVFSIQTKDDFDRVNQFKKCDLFLFDTKTPGFGGSGKTFDWSLLSHYKGDIKFFLAGGIGINSLEQINKLNHPALHGLDINSRFETKPGLKDVELIVKFLKQL